MSIDAQREREEQHDHHDGDPSRVLEHPRALRAGHAPRVTLGGAAFCVVAAGTLGRMAISGVADLTGRVLAGRYRLLAPIGAGASGRVYVADDVRLRRRVAVKVLHAALADDAGFLRRFRAEAQVAASLHHPNVMAVYDWGEDDVPFMVLELLRGGSLRGLLDADEHLTLAQAAHVGRQVTAALEYAHVRGLVHRDIKPANLLFDEHGIVRVADFGLARALAEASWTEPAGSVVGTARYAAPEQASGAPLDGRADLYSLAIVLVESVTGTVPAMSDTAIGTLAARQHTPVARAARARSSRPGRRTRRATGSGRALPRCRHDGRRAGRRGACVPACAAACAPRARRRWRRRRRSHADRRCARRRCSTRTRRRRDGGSAGAGPAARRAEAPDRSVSCRWSCAFAVIARVGRRRPRARRRQAEARSRCRRSSGSASTTAKIQVATAGLTVADRRAQRRRPAGRRDRAAPAREDRSPATHRVGWSCHAGRRRCRSRMSGRCRPKTRRRGSRRPASSSPSTRPNDETVPDNDVIGTDPPSARRCPRDSEISCS